MKSIHQLALKICKLRKTSYKNSENCKKKNIILCDSPGQVPIMPVYINHLEQMILYYLILFMFIASFPFPNDLSLNELIQLYRCCILAKNLQNQSHSFMSSVFLGAIRFKTQLNFLRTNKLKLKKFE